MLITRDIEVGQRLLLPLICLYIQQVSFCLLDEVGIHPTSQDNGTRYVTNTESYQICFVMEVGQGCLGHEVSISEVSNFEHRHRDAVFEGVQLLFHEHRPGLTEIES